MLFTLSIFGLGAMVALVLAYHRTTILPYLPPRLVAILPSTNRFRAYVPLSTFESQRDAGLSSAAFDLEANISDDPRAGLDERGVEEVTRIMQSQGVSFDQARLIRHKQILAQNGIDPSGMPLDSKAVTRL